MELGGRSGKGIRRIGKATAEAVEVDKKLMQQRTSTTGNIACSLMPSLRAQTCGWWHGALLACCCLPSPTGLELSRSVQVDLRESSGRLYSRKDASSVVVKFRSVVTFCVAVMM